MSKNNFRPSYQAKLPKTDHNLSQKVIFTSSVGHLLPVYHTIVNPSENIKMDLEIFTRTQPLVSAAFLDITENVDVFFIPFDKMLTSFGNKVYDNTDYLSSMLAGDETLNFPKLTLRTFTSDGGSPAKYYNLYIDEVINESDNGDVNGRLSGIRLFNHLHYNPSIFLSDSSHGEATSGTLLMPAVFPYALLAYHAIYYDYFSLQDYEKRFVKDYNFDYLTFNSSEGYTTRLCKLHYVPYEFDYFQNSYVSPLLSDKNVLVNFNNNSIKSAMRLYLGNDNIVAPSDSTGGGTTSAEDFVQVSAANDGAYALATNQLRANFAMEKYLRVLGKADKTYDAQVLAHFGFKVPTDVKHSVQHIGHFESQIHIGEVVSTAQTVDANATTGASLGEIAGKGYGANKRDKVVDFTAPCHGVLMAVYYAKPKRIYSTYGFDKINMFTGPESLWNPEFDALGAQPIFRGELLFNGWSFDSEIQAWQNRFQEFKQKYDWASLAFNDPNGSQPTPSGFNGFNDWTSWINGQVPFKLDRYGSVDPDLNYKGRLVQPSDLNRLFTVPFVATWNETYRNNLHLIFQGDPLMHSLNFHVTLWSPMSKTGEPRMDF